MQILSLTSEMVDYVEQSAELLVLAFAQYGAWTTIEEARQEVQEILAPDRILRLAIEGDEVLGWIGGIPKYDGNVWELHPLVVRPERQRKGIGTALVWDFEAQVREKGGITILLGTDDMDFQTSLAGVNLYENTWEYIRTIRNLKSHPYEFYHKLGYTIVGVVPDANGHGKPDIYMAKRV